MFTVYMKAGGVFEGDTLDDLFSGMVEIYENADYQCEDIEAITMVFDDYEMQFKQKSCMEFQDKIEQRLSELKQESYNNDTGEHSTYGF